MKTKTRLGLIVVAVFVFSLLSSPSIVTQGQTNEPCVNPVFEISLLSPNTNPQRNAWSSLMEEEFPKACIGIKTHLSTDWTTIAARTWAFDVGSTDDNQVPGFDDGGFDVLFVGYSNPSAPTVTVDDLYHSNQFPEKGGFNFYHFDNSTFDSKHDQMVQELDNDERNALASDIQGILHEEQPSLTLLYPESLWAYSDDMTLSDGDLFGLSTATVGDDWKGYGIDGVSDLVYGHSYDVSEFIPHLANSYIAAQYQSAIWQGLYQRNLDTQEWEPLLADGMPEYSDDGKTVTVSINENATFADGESVDSEDVVESFKQIMDPDWGHISIASVITYFGNSTLSGGDKAVGDIVSAVNDSAVEFNLLQPYFDVPSLISFAIFPTHMWGTQADPAEDDYDFNGAMVNKTKAEGIEKYGWGTGPFMYNDIDGTSGNIELIRTNETFTEEGEGYWNGDVASEKISFQKFDTKAPALTALEDGTVHIIDSQLKPSLGEVEGVDGVQSKTVVDYSWQEIAINNQHPILGTGEATPLGQDNPERAAEAAKYVRQAMSHAIPRQTIIDEIAEGLATPGITAGWAPGTIGYDDQYEPYEYSIKLAKEKLAMAGYDIEAAERESLLAPPSLLSIAFFATAVVAVFARKLKKQDI